MMTGGATIKKGTHTFSKAYIQTNCQGGLVTSSPSIGSSPRGGAMVSARRQINKKIPATISIIIGGILGFISGVVGIGGGIFLSPILFLLKADKPKYIITVASVFILINSISGIIGQLTKNIVLLEIQNYWYLLVAVLIGGQMGNFLNLKIFPVRILALVTASLVLFVALRMGIRLF